MTLLKTVSFISLLFLLLSGCDSSGPESLDQSLQPNASDEMILVEKEPAKAAKAMETSAEDDKHTLWKLNGKNGNTMYLVGSVHLMKPDVYPLDDVFQTAFAEAEKVVFEIDEEIQDPVAAQQAVQKYASIEGGGLLKDRINASDYAEIKKLAKKNKVPMMIIDPFDPWFSSMNLAVMQYMNAGMSPEFGIDIHFMQRAQEAGKPILGLETMADQFGILDSVSYDLQVQMLKDVLTEEDQTIAMVDEIDENWREGDMQELEELLMTEFEDSPEFYNKLLKKRNENWIPQLVKMLDDTDDYLVVVGTAHMLGDDGILTLLEKEGYSAKQL